MNERPGVGAYLARVLRVAPADLDMDLLHVNKHQHHLHSFLQLCTEPKLTVLSHFLSLLHGFLELFNQEMN